MQELDFIEKSPIYSFLHQLFGSSKQILCCYNEEGEMLYCTQAYLTFFNAQSRQELVKKFQSHNPLTQKNGQSSFEACKEKLQKAFQEHGTTFSWVHVLSSGEHVQVRYALTRLEFQGIPIISAVLLGTQKNTLTLADYYYQDNNVRAIVEASPLAICLWNKRHELIDCNESFIQLFNLKNKEEYTLQPHAFYPTTQQNGMSSEAYSTQLLEQAFSEGQSQGDWLWQNQDGTLIPSFTSLRRVKYGGKDMVAEYIYDLRTLQESQHRATQAELRNQIVLQAMPLSMSFWDKDYNLIDCNAASINLFGFKDKEEYIAKCHEVSPKFQPNGDPSLTTLHKKFDEAMEKGVSHVQWTHQKPDGTPIPVDKTCVRANLNHEDVIITFSRDIRDVVASKKETQEAEERNKSILEAMPLGVLFWDENFELIDCNNESLKLYGFQTKDALKESFSLTYPPQQPSGEDSASFIKAHLQKALNEGYSYMELLCLTQTEQGEEGIDNNLPVEVILTRTTYKKGYGLLCYIRDLRAHKAMLAEIQMVEDDLRAAKDIAEKNAAAKSEFLANMSHEIRTPMNGMIGLLHLLAQTHLHAEQEKYVEKSLTSAKNLLRIINDILDFSNIESGRFEFQEAPFKMYETIMDIKALYAPMAYKKDIAFHAHMQENNDVILGDELRLKQVLFNMLDNAFKFTAAGSISISVEEKWLNNAQKKFTFAVKDTGIGIAPEDISRIFSAFSQADTSFTRAYGGTGLGLVISQSIIHMQGGEIWVESEKGQGSTFYCSAVFDVLQSLHADTKEDTSASQNAVKKPGHLLLVEDNEINQIVAEEILVYMGYTLDIANNGQEALDMLEKNCYDLVLMDIQMPVMDGLTAAKKIREQEKFKKLPIVALSAHILEEDVQKSLAHGMNAHTTKPIVPEELSQTIAHWIEKMPAHG